MNEDQSVTDAYSLPLDCGNKLSLVFRKLPLTSRDRERIAAFVELVMEALINPLTPEIQRADGPPRRMRTKLTTDDQAAKIERNIRIKEAELLRQKAREQTYSVRSGDSSPVPWTQSGTEPTANSDGTSR